MLLRAMLGARVGVLPDAVRERSNRGAVEQEQKKSGDRRFVHRVACVDAKQRQHRHNQQEISFKVSDMHFTGEGQQKQLAEPLINAV